MTVTQDFSQAERFLTRLDEEAESHIFQTFDDVKLPDGTKRKDPQLTGVLIGTIEEHWEILCRRNKQGAGIFVTVNATDGSGRKKESITCVRAIWQEQDRPGCPELPTAPHIEVESSPGRHHRYILIDGCPPDAFQGLQDRMVESYGSDPAAADISRVLRLPGFFHMKNPDQPHMVRIVAESGELPLSYAEAARIFPPVAQKPLTVPPVNTSLGPEGTAEIISAVYSLSPDLDYQAWLNVGMALHDRFGGGIDGLRIWDEWSAGGTSYRDGECSYKWGTFNPGGGVTIQTLFKMAAETGWRWSKCEPAEGLGNEGQACANINPIKLLEAFTVKKEYTDKLGQEEFLIKNLLIKQHILVVVAMPGGGKTAFFFRHVAPTLAGKGLKVFYMDCDSPASDHRAMRELAEHHGFSFLNPDANQGTSIELLKKTLQQIADADTDLNGWVFIFDTLKKFADLMQKNAVKEFFKMCRRLTGRGASVVLLAHSNKHRSTEGFLVPEGVGDVRNDADDLIIFERSKNANGGIDVTTVVDTDRNAKVRGIFQPFSFHVSPERKISFYKFPLTITDPTQTAATKATDDEIMDAATRALEDMAGEVTQQALVSRVCDMTGAGNKRVRELIVQNAERGDASEKRGLRFWYVIGEHNRFMYRLPDIPPEQVTIFDSNQFGKHDLGFTN